VSTKGNLLTLSLKTSLDFLVARIGAKQRALLAVELSSLWALVHALNSLAPSKCETRKVLANAVDGIQSRSF